MNERMEFLVFSGQWYLYHKRMACGFYYIYDVIEGMKYVCMYVCMYVCISQFATYFSEEHAWGMAQICRYQKMANLPFFTYYGLVSCMYSVRIPFH